MTAVWEKWVVLAVFLIAIVLLVKEVRTPESILFGCVIVIWNLGIISGPDAMVEIFL